MTGIERLRRQRRRYAVTGLLLAAAALLLVAASAALGAMALPVHDTARILWGKLFGNAAALAPFADNKIAVVWAIRLPRVLSALLCGMGLSVAGAIFQSLLGNPLADPYTLGVSTGAAFGATAAIYCNVVYGLFVPVTPMAFLTALLALLAVLAIARRGGGFSAGTLVIAGMIVSTILSAGVSFLKKISGESVSAIVYWLMGSFSAKQWTDVALLAAVILPCIALACVGAQKLNLMSLGDRAAQALGIHPQRTRLVLLLAGALITAACVSTAGIIGFVGLIIPHMLRMWLTSDNRALLPLSALAGGLLLLLADDAARLLGNGDMPVGVLTTLLGGPFFIYLFLRGRQAA